MTDDRTPKRYCGAPTRSGGTCRHSTNLSEVNGCCLVHDPQRREEWRAATRRGQQHSVAARAEIRRRDMALLADKLERPPVGDDLESLARFHLFVIEATARGEMDLGQSRTHTAAVRVQQGVYEKRDLLRRLTELEKRIKALSTENKRLKGGAR